MRLRGRRRAAIDEKSHGVFAFDGSEQPVVAQITGLEFFRAEQEGAALAQHAGGRRNFRAGEHAAVGLEFEFVEQATSAEPRADFVRTHHFDGVLGKMLHTGRADLASLVLQVPDMKGFADTANETKPPVA